MKKSILFIIPSLGIGGGEKSLINLLEQIDYDKYHVDLFVLRKEGLFIDFVPEQVNFIDIPKNLQIFQLPLQKSVIKFIMKAKFNLAYHRIMFSLKNRYRTSISKREQYSWKHLRCVIGILEKKYDISIGYLEKTSNYICIDCIYADKKIGWIHTDYTKLEANREFDSQYFTKLNSIVTISTECKNMLKREFPKLENKIKIIRNIVSPTTILKMSNENLEIKLNSNEIVIVSVGRLSYEKGFDIAINASKILKDKGYKFKWLFIGDGPERESLEALIKEKEMDNNCFLVGVSPNPYKYISRSDVYVQPSRFEGKSIAMDEAKILNKPIVSTNFSTVYDQLTNGFDGIITEMIPSELANGIIELIENVELKQSIISNLKQMYLGTESEINKLYEIIN